MAAPSCSINQGAQPAVLPSWVATIATLSARIAQVSSISRLTVCAAVTLSSSRGERISMVNRTRPGMTLIAPGKASSCPTVATRSGVLRASVSIANTHSDAAANASLRRFIGTVPACPATPWISTTKRLAPLIAVTTPTANPSASSTGPCSMCSSTKAATSSRCRAAWATLRGSSPNCSIAFRMLMPSRSVLSSVAKSNVPAIARLPSSVAEKRTPSSSAKPATSIANGSLVPLAFSACTHSMAATTPSIPSYFPASRTVSKCEPSIKQGKLDRVPS